MVSLAPLLVCDLSLQACPRVCCSDASLDGAGVAVGLIGAEEVTSACSYSDLWRFSTELQRSWGPRRQAMEESHLAPEVEAFCNDLRNDEMSRKLIHSRLVPALPYVRGSLLDSTWDQWYRGLGNLRKILLCWRVVLL